MNERSSKTFTRQKIKNVTCTPDKESIKKMRGKGGNTQSTF